MVNFVPLIPKFIMQKSIRLVSGLYLKLSLLTVAVGLVLRVVLLFNEQTTSLAFSFGEWCEVFLLGAVNDFCAATAGFIFLWLFMLSVSRTKYRKPWGYILLALLVAAFCYVAFFNTIFDEYGSVAPRIALYVLGYWAGSFALRLFLPGFRSHWTTVWFALFIVVYVGAIIFNGISEYFFWSEFGVRYNFIAVDYLVYTNEVVGNIMESYPVVPLFAGVLLLTVGCTWLLFRREIRRAGEFGTWQWKAAVSPAYLLLTLGCCLLLQFNTRFQQSANTYANELQATGAYKFYDAFMKNELSYPQFYLTLPQKEAEANVHAIYGSTGDNLRHIPGNPDTLRRNIVLITIESMSASFMQHFGYPDAITPHLDSLYKMGIAFEQCFATGNRTVRGLEAVTLSLPPCPGQSIIKRPRNDNMHSTAAVLREKGYDAYYFYGGNSYFDNMETFFGGNGYRIIDQKSYKPEEITFANIWGVCDEDAYDKVIRSLGERADTTAAPFFAHVMTVSNHRPYTYPAGRIPIPNDAKLRSGGVMYTDYALGRFFEEASRQPWFDNTVFVITADHCASSAGKTEIPLEKYHIPALIFAPGLITPQQVDKVISQIDLMPTLFSLLGMDYDSHFFGQDALSDDFRERAFVATYQDLGYLEGDVFTVLSPVNRAEQYRISPTEEDRYNLVLEEGIPSQELLDRAISLYQTSSAWNTRP